MNREQVSTHSVPGNRNSAGTGNIIILEDIDRELFIKNCYKNGTVSLLTPNGERFDNVLVNESEWNYIKFPKTSKELGSLVAWMNIPKQNQPILISVLRKREEPSTQIENEILFEKTLEGFANIQISLNPKNGSLLLQVEGKDNLGDITLKSSNSNKTSTINIISDDLINLQSRLFRLSALDKFEFLVKDPTEDVETKILYERGEGFYYKDEFGNQIDMDEEKIQIQTDTKSIIFGTGKEPIALAESCKKVIDKFVDLVSKATTTTSLGQMPLINAAEIAKIKDETKTFFSKLVKSD